MTKETKYIELQYAEPSQELLRKYCTDNKFDLTIDYDGSDQKYDQFDFHTTVFFSTSEHELENKSIELASKIDDIDAVKFSLFGEDKNILVLEINSPKLVAIRTMFEDDLSMADAWPEYKPHITLSYNYVGKLPSVDLPDLTDLFGDKINIKSQN